MTHVEPEPGRPVDARSASRPTIAVVAVHGVGEHAPGESAHSIADLLLRIHDHDAPQYTAFHERAVRVPTKPAVVHDRTRPTMPDSVKRSIFSEQSDYVLAQHLAGTERRPSRSSDAPEHQFMRAQLERYESSGTPYDTVCLEGERLGPAPANELPTPEAGVHVYEMYWSDLSQMGANGIGFFGAVYQLLFDLAHLGRIAVDHARIEFRTSLVWRLFGTTQQWAVRMLTVFVPAVWLVMLATILGALVLQVSESLKPYIVVGAAGAALIALGLALAYWAAEEGPVLTFPFFPIVSVGLTALIALRVHHEVVEGHVDHLNRWLLAVWLALAGGLLHLVFRAYERVRPGVRVVGMAAYAVAALAIVVFIIPQRSASMFPRTVHLFEIETAVIVAIWYALYLLGAIATVLGLVAVSGTMPKTGERRRATAVAWTARTTLGASASMVLVVTFVMWAAVLGVSKNMLPTTKTISPIVPLFTTDGAGARSYGDFFTMMLSVTSGPGFALVAYVLCGIALVAFIALVPAVIKEIFPPQAGSLFRMTANQSPSPSAAEARDTQIRDDHASERLGAWLNGGLRWVGTAAGLLIVPTFLFMPALNLWRYFAPHVPSLLVLSEQMSLRIILGAGGALTATAVGLVAFRSRLDALALGFRPVVDAALDVDNYLREHPRTNTPRARIAERYTSLLRHLCHWRDADGQPYAAITLVTHSQGTVISADLLNFIEREPDPELSAIRLGELREPAVYLFTMGSPLRQLYAASFPHLFGWIRGDSNEWFQKPEEAPAPVNADAPSADGTGVGHVVAGPAIDNAASPDPWRIGVTRWVNAYRSGDYVGRSLWRIDMEEAHSLYRCATPTEAGSTPAQPTIEVTEDARGARRELCIGAGAHTHYWDDTAKAIAAELDLLIADATASAVASRGRDVGLTARAR